MQEIEKFRELVASNNVGKLVESLQNKKTNVLNLFDWKSTIESFQKDKKSVFECLKVTTLLDFSKQENLKKVTRENITIPNISDEAMKYLLANLSDEDKNRLRAEILISQEIYQKLSTIILNTES